MKQLALFLTFGLILCFNSHAFGQYQNHLILKKGYKNRLHFLTGDSIRFLSERSEKPIIGYLQAIGEDFIVVNDEQFPIKEINTIFYKRKSFNFVSTGKILQIAGPGFLIISGFNALLWSIRPIWSTANLVTSGSLLGLGLILPKFQQRDFEIGQKFFLRIVPSDPETMRKEPTN